MNMFARFDENPAMTLKDIKKTKHYERTDAHTDIVKTVYPPQTKFAGGIKICKFFWIWISGSGDIILRDYLSRALVVILLSGVKPF